MGIITLWDACTEELFANHSISWLVDNLSGIHPSNLGCPYLVFPSDARSSTGELVNAFSEGSDMIHRTWGTFFRIKQFLSWNSSMSLTHFPLRRKRAWDELFGSHFPCGNTQIVGQMPSLKINQINTILNVWDEVNLYCLATEMLPIWYPDMLKHFFSCWSCKAFLL